MNHFLARSVRRLLSSAVSALTSLDTRRPRDESPPAPAAPPPPVTAAEPRDRAKMAYRMNAAAHRTSSWKPGYLSPEKTSGR